MQAQHRVSVPYAESFENGLAGWQTIDGDGDGLNWRAVDFSTIPPSIAAIIGYFAFDGNHVVYSESVSDNGTPLQVSNWLISPAMTLPSSDSTLLSWWVKTCVADANDIYEVRIGTVYDTIVDTLDYIDVLFTDTVSNTVYKQRSLNISDYAGMLVRVAFHHIGGSSSLQLDNVVVGNDSLPLVSIVGPMGIDINDTATYIASWVSGSTDGLYYEWICDDADYIEDMGGGDTIRIVWTQGGLRRVGLVATNSYGTDTVWMEVAVSNCGVVDTFPFHETFSLSSTTLACWKMFDGDADGTAWTIGDGEATSLSTTFYGMYPEQDNWLITPPLSPNGDMLQLSWQVKPHSDSYSREHYSVLVSNGGNVYDAASYIELFAETTSDPYNWTTHYLSLAEYAFDTIRLAFRHYNTDDQEYLHLTNVNVEHASAPIVAIRMPETAIVGDAVPFGLDTFSVSLINDITWTIWTDTLGSIQTFSYLGPFSYTWPDGTVEGDYRVSVEVTNDVGTTADTAWIHLHICDVDTVPYQHSFGTDDDCWRIDDGWYIGDTMTVNGTDVSAAVSFSHDELGNELHADNTIATPWLYIPSGNYEIRYYVSELPQLFFDDGRIDRYSVIVRTPSRADTLFTGVVSGDAPLEYRFSLRAYADSTIQVAFRHHDSPVGFGLRLAEVGVTVVAPPVVTISAPQRARTGESVSIAASVVSSETLTYSWQIDGAMPDTASGSPVTAQWFVLGTYAIHLTATSPLYGPFSTTDTITVIDCSGLEDLPYTEHFNLDMGCWKSYDLDLDGYGWEMAVGNSLVDQMFAQGLAYGGSGNSIVSWSTRPSGDLFTYILGAAGTPLDADNLIVSPAMTLPDSGNWEATFHMASVASILSQMLDASGSNYDSAAIMVTTTEGLSSLSDYDVLIPLHAVDSVGFSTYTVSLNAYRGQTIRLAVRHRTTASVGLLLDEVNVSSIAPQYTLTVVSDNDEMGIVNGGGTYTSGAQALLTASAYNGYHFDHWHDGNTDNPRVVIVSADATYIAIFVSTTPSQDIDDVDTEGNITVFVSDGRIVVGGADNENVKVFDIMGREIQTFKKTSHLALPSGVYIVKVGEHATRKVVVVR